jgi:xanthine dehydrogenase accessory factor
MSEGARIDSDGLTHNSLVMLRGGGDLGTGVAHRLLRSGYRVVVLETAEPRAVRRRVAFAEAVKEGETTVEGVLARKVSKDEVNSAWRAPGQAAGGGRPSPWVPVLVDPDAESMSALKPDVVIDARMAKRNLGISREDARLTVALGPGFEAGRDVDIVIETMRGHSLGTVIEEGAALPDTGVPGEVAGVSVERLLRSPTKGVFIASRVIGDVVDEGEEVGTVSGQPVVAATSGIVRGLIADGVSVSEGEKVGDIDRRGREVDPGAISDKARAIGGAVLEALLSRGMLPGPPE